MRRHARYRGQLDAYVDGLLSAGDAARLERHLRSCDACRDEVDGLRSTLELLRELPAVDPPVGLETRLLAGLREQREAEARPGWLRGWGAPAATAAVGLAAFLVVSDVEVSIGLPEAADATLATPAASPEPASPRVARFAPLPVAKAPDAAPPSLRACLDVDPRNRDACTRWHAWMMDLGSRDPIAFMSEFDAVPETERPQMWGQFRQLAWDTGSASVLIDRLRSSGHPRATSLAGRLARVSSSDR